MTDLIPCECHAAGSRYCLARGTMKPSDAVTWRPSAREVYVVSYRCRRRLRVTALRERLASRPAPKRVRELDVDAIAARRRAALGAAS